MGWRLGHPPPWSELETQWDRCGHVWVKARPRHQLPVGATLLWASGVTWVHGDTSAWPCSTPASLDCLGTWQSTQKSLQSKQLTGRPHSSHKGCGPAGGPGAVSGPLST